jgi:ribonuclease HII
VTVADPTLEFEESLHASGARFVIGCDEVGRGAIAGPVAVGLSLVDADIAPHPAGLRDSKLLSEKRREALEPLARAWVRSSAVGMADASEVDEIGIMAALALAGRRAFDALVADRGILPETVVLLDGSHDWLSGSLGSSGPVVRTRVKADRDCASVAAASVIAKVHRDRLMIDADALTPGYHWAGNKGYASAQHYAAIDELGPTDLHRRTWLRAPRPALF